MTKPAVTLKGVKGSPLTTSELDTNFTNLRDSTINFTDGTNTLSMDLNDTITVQGDPQRNLPVTVSEAGNVITIDNEISDYTRDPSGFQNRTDSTISFNNSTRTLSISVTSGSSAFRVWVTGYQYTKTATETLTVPNTTALYHIYYDSAGELQYQTAELDFSLQTPVAYVYWNATNSQSLISDERHGVSMDWATKYFLHKTQGATYSNGFSASNYTTSGSGSSNADAQLDIDGGTFFDQDLAVTITHSNSPTAFTWEQDLQGPARIPVLYRLNGAWTLDAARDYPVKNGTSLVTYNLNTAGTWSTPDCGSNKYVTYWIIATSTFGSPILSIMGQAEHTNIGDAQTLDTWNNLDLSDFPAEEVRPLYKLIFKTSSTYANTPKAYLAEITDIRLDSLTGISAGTSTAAFQNIVVGATTITADSATGTLTLTAGSGITLTPNATTDTIDIAATSVVNSGAANALAYYPSAGTTIDDSSVTWDGLTLKLDAATPGEARIQGDTGDALRLISAGTYPVQILLTQNNGNLNLIPASIGKTILGNGASNQTLTSSGAYTLTVTTGGSADLILNTNNGTNSGSITIADGANQNITISPDGTGKLSVSKAIYSTVSAGVAFVDSYDNAASYANGATVNFSDFSGMVMINRQDGSSGNVALWLCGGGVANKLGDSQANACGTIAGNGGVNGYTWTNDTGVTITASFTAIRGRTGG